MKIYLAKEMMYQNEEIQGELYLMPYQQIIIQDITIKVGIEEGWVFQETSDIVYNYLCEIIIYQFPLNIGKLLNINTQLITLPVQEFEFPFIIKKPKEIIP